MAENNLIIDATSSGSIDGIKFGSTASLGAYANVLISSINLGDSVDIATIADSAGKNASLTLDGGAGFDRLNGNSADNDLTLTGLDKGTLDKVSFSNIENIYLQGGNDTVTIENGGRLSGLLDGGAGNNTLIVDDGTPITIGGDGKIIVGGGGSGGGSGGGYKNFNNIKGKNNGSQNNRLILNSNSNNVSITGPNSGTADGTAFTNISDIDLAAGNDNAILASTGSLSGTLKGGEGNDDLFLNSSDNILDIDHDGKGKVRSNGDEYTVTDTTIAAATLISLDKTYQGNIDASAVTTITGEASDLITVYVSKGISGLGNEATTISDTKIGADILNLLDAYTTGVINAASITTLI